MLDFKTQLEEVQRQLEESDRFDPACGQAALATFEFSQNLVKRWRGSNWASKREILEVVSSNRQLSDVSLVLTKRKPFDFLVERPFLKKSRGDWQNLELEVQPYTMVFLLRAEPHILRISEIMRQTD